MEDLLHLGFALLLKAIFSRQRNGSPFQCSGSIVHASQVAKDSQGHVQHDNAIKDGQKNAKLGHELVGGSALDQRIVFGVVENGPGFDLEAMEAAKVPKAHVENEKDRGLGQLGLDVASGDKDGSKTGNGGSQQEPECNVVGVWVAVEAALEHQDSHGNAGNMVKEHSNVRIDLDVVVPIRIHWEDGIHGKHIRNFESELEHVTRKKRSM